MKNKGFTLTEIIGAIIILGILAVIAVITFTGSMQGFRDDYYTDTVRTLTESGKEFFNDNRKYRPGSILEAKVIPINTLVSQHYLEDIKDYKGNSCSNTSYVIIIKNGKDDYSYHACLVCSEDDFSNMSDKYCDSAWTNSTTIEYSIATPPELYVYKGTPRAGLRDQLAIKVSYVKKNAKGEVIGVVDGTGFDDVPTIYPDNIDGIDTNKLGEYPIDYTYQGNTTRGRVVVYEYGEPGLTITKENIVATNLTTGTQTQTGAYTSGEWTQKIKITMTPGTINAGGVDLSTTNLSNIVHRFQWNKDGVWQDFCNGDSCSEKVVETEMNESIRFRSVNVDGRVSENTGPTIIRIDHTKPTCDLLSTGEHKGNDWFTSNVGVNFSSNKDLVGTSSEAVSGVAVSHIYKPGEAFNRNNITNVINLTHTQDITTVTYTGFVEDKAHNFKICSVTFRKDATDPICTVISTGTRENATNPWYNSPSVSISFNEYYDETSLVETYGIGSYTGAHQIVDPQDTGGITYTGYIKDKAGNTSTCTTSYKKDSTLPLCALTTSGEHKGNDWYTSNVTVSFIEGSPNTYDNLSGVRSHGIGTYEGNGSPIVHTEDTAGITYTGYIIDNAGNRNSCTTNFRKDATVPVCSIISTGTRENASNPWYYSPSVSVSFNEYYDETSFVETYGIGSFTGAHQIVDPQDTGGITYTGYIKDKAGNEATCTTSYKKDSTKPECALTTSGEHKGNDWYTSNVTVSFASADDNLSGIRSHGIGTYSGNGESTTHTADTTNVTYTGMIIDNAGNTNSCTTNFRKDATNPVCSIISTGTRENASNPWYYSPSVSISFNEYYDETSLVETYGIGSYTGNHQVVDPQDTGGITYTGYIKDKAGNTSTCTTSYMKDSTKPECALTTSGTMGNDSWYISSTVSVSFSSTTDNLSAVNSYGIGGITEPRIMTQSANTAGVTYTGHIKDNAGNTNTCQVSFKKDDASEAIAGGCSASGNTSWTNAEWITITHRVNVAPISGCVPTSGSGYHFSSYCVEDYQARAEAGTAVATRQAPATSFSSKSGVSIPCPAYTEDIYIDHENPTCESSGGSTAWVNTDLTVIGTCNDASGSGCATPTVQLPTFTSTTEQYNVTPGTVRDKVGNETQCPADQTVKIDKINPTCTSASSPAGWTNGNVTVTGTCADTGGSGCASNVTDTFSGQQDSQQTPGTVYDNAGNSVLCPTSAVHIDTTAPTCTSASNPGGWTNGSVTVTGTCADTGGSGCAGNVTDTFSGQQDSQQTPGTVYDIAGNSVLCPTSAVHIDTTAPTCTSASSPSDWTNGSVTVSGTCYDTGGSGCAGNTSNTFSGQQDSQQTPGTVYDNAGNSVLCPTSGVHIDTTPPTCNTVSSHTGWTNQQVTLTGVCTDTGGSGCKPNITTGYADEQNSMQSPGSVLDYAGNEAACPRVSVTIDRTLPTCTLSTSTPNTWTNGSVTVRGQCSDMGGSGCAGNAEAVFSGQQNSMQSPGKVYDNAGNASLSDCPTSAVKIDTTPPTCYSRRYGSDSSSGVSVTFTCSDRGGSDCYARSSSTTATSSGSLSISDKAGNSTSCDYSVSSYQKYRYRYYSYCATGDPNECVSWGYGYQMCGCATREDSSCNSGCSAGGSCGYSMWAGNGCAKTGCVSNNDGTFTITECGCCQYDKCNRYENTCEPGWLGWNGYYRGTCTSGNSSSYQCEEITMYTGG